MRNLDDELIVRLKRRAARHGRSTKAERRKILRQALADENEPSFDKLAACYKKAGIPDRLRTRLYEAPHEFNAEMQAEAWTWLKKWV